MVGAMEAAAFGHEPVMVAEVLAALQPRAGETVVDCTVGRGGHLAAVCAAIGQSGTVLAMDVDPENLAFARGRVGESFGDGGRVRYFHANFAELEDVLSSAKIAKVDVLLADLGVSTNQLIEKSHGLSFNEEGPLDMRLDPRIKRSAADLLAELSEREIADVLFENADERASFKIARKIVQTRVSEPIRTTDQLARLVRSVMPRPAFGAIDPATRTFQALRMEVNAERESLAGLLEAVPKVMQRGGRAGIISFHSGEDRMVKVATREWASAGWCDVLTKKPLEPSDAEIMRNPRSRSAKFRAAVWK